ncbi:hypothetical protein [Amycolatopsis decaplanina]|uniref:Uncharacterized protein n=1 Tax=Amycolatopsis decaplanina DSM 44594 TaxID=1284240 RepID=M2XQQ0_9PSEU|nr:hypothetical protein [Amycolatopsis decaplanina]EME63346.1 hypothetical protein H074_05592 [Amycolatopsis decaplanina DSM 44594]
MISVDSTNIRAHQQVLSTRVDTMAGTEFSLRQRRLDWVPVECLLEPVIATTRTYEFDEAVFDLPSERLEAGLPADTVRLVGLLPLNDFTASMAEISLSDGVVLRPMTTSISGHTAQKTSSSESSKPMTPQSSQRGPSRCSHSNRAEPASRCGKRPVKIPAPSPRA